MNDPRERERAGTPAEERQAEVRDADAPGDEADRAGRVPPPSPEEAPELLGERSDYPVPFGDES
jgi:hypothetical protein